MLAEPTILLSHDPELVMCAVVAGGTRARTGMLVRGEPVDWPMQVKLCSSPFSCIPSRRGRVSLQASFPRKWKEALMPSTLEECAVRRLHCPGPVIHSLKSEGPARPPRLDPKLQISHELTVGLPLAKLGLTGWIPIPQLT